MNNKLNNLIINSIYIEMNWNQLILYWNELKSIDFVLKWIEINWICIEINENDWICIEINEIWLKIDHLKPRIGENDWFFTFSVAGTYIGQKTAKLTPFWLKMRGKYQKQGRFLENLIFIQKPAKKTVYNSI